VTLRAGVIGLGVGEQHVRGYDAHPDCEVVAVCDIDAARLEPYAHLRTTTDPAELLADPDVDVVSVASYDDAHFEQIRLALEHGKHVFAEKPLVLYEAEAVEVARLLAERPELVLSTNVPLRRSPRFVALRERIRAGELGTVFLMEGDYDYGRRHKLTDGWRGRIPYYSVFLGGGIHMVDLLLWLTGDRVTEVVSAQGNRIATAQSAFSHYDCVMATMRTESGALMKVNANLGSISPHFHAVRVFGTDGTFVNGLPDGVLHRPGGVSEPVTEDYPGVGKDVLIGSFLDAILTGAPAEVTAADVFSTLSVCMAVERALETGETVGVVDLLPSSGS
jgi:predicted dehydrogenase